jgi:hypothetical protein
MIISHPFDVEEAQYRKIELNGHQLRKGIGLQEHPYHAVLVDYDLGLNTGIR